MRVRKIALRVTCMVALFVIPAISYALPKEGIVPKGSATIREPNATTIHIDQVTERAVLNWKSFDIAKGELVEFRQPSSTAVALNRIWGGEPSIILGQLRPN